MDGSLPCPLTDEQHLSALEKRVAEAAVRDWWRGFPWPPFLLVCGVVITLTGVIWSAMATRVNALDTAVTTHFIGTATATSDIDRLKQEVEKLSGRVENVQASISARDEQTAENNRLLRRLVAHIGAK